MRRFCRPFFAHILEIGCKNHVPKLRTVIPDHPHALPFDSVGEIRSHSLGAETGPLMAGLVAAEVCLCSWLNQAPFERF